MKKSIATVIAAISFLAACGTCGALECDVISPMDFIIRRAVCFAFLFASLRVVRDEERFEVEAAGRRFMHATLISCAFDCEDLPLNVVEEMF